MIENPALKVLERLTHMAEMHGTVYCQVTWDATKDEFLFTTLLKEFVEVNFERKKDD